MQKCNFIFWNWTQLAHEPPNSSQQWGSTRSCPFKFSYHFPFKSSFFFQGKSVFCFLSCSQDDNQSPGKRSLVLALSSCPPWSSWGVSYPEWNLQFMELKLQGFSFMELLLSLGRGHSDGFRWSDFIILTEVKDVNRQDHCCLPLDFHSIKTVLCVKWLWSGCSNFGAQSGSGHEDAFNLYLVWYLLFQSLLWIVNYMLASRG